MEDPSIRLRRDHLYAQVRSFFLNGAQAEWIDVEVEAGRGLPALHIVGLPDAVARQCRNRVRSAIAASGLPYPSGRVTVNFTPALEERTGSVYELPVALGILAAAGAFEPSALEGWAAAGELGLNGRLRPVQGAICAGQAAAEEGFRLLLPVENAWELSLLRHLSIVVASNLIEAVQAVATGGKARAARSGPHEDCAWPDAAGQEAWARIGDRPFVARAAVIAAAGGHHLGVLTRPGLDGRAVALAVRGLLPPLQPAERIEAGRAHSAAGLPSLAEVLKGAPPFEELRQRRPSRRLGVRPAGIEPALAHLGVLLAEDLPAHKESVLTELRQSLKTRRLAGGLDDGWAGVPSRFLLTATMHPCPCGWLGDEARTCSCTPSRISRHWNRMVEAVAESIDVWATLDARTWLAGGLGSDRGLERGRRAVGEARRRQIDRQGCLNSELEAGRIRRCIGGTLVSDELLAAHGLCETSAAAVLRVARSIADLDGSDSVWSEHVVEALAYRRPPLAEAQQG